MSRAGETIAPGLAGSSLDPMEWRDEFYRYDRKWPLEAEEREEPADGLSRRLRVRFAGARDARIPGILDIPREAAGRVPAVVVQHGMHGDKETIYIRAIADLLLESRFAAMAIDSQYHGERAREGRDPEFHNMTSYRNRDAFVQSVLDLMRTVDYLSTRPEVDAERIGFVGFSQGAITGAVFGGLDPRARAVALVLGGAGFRRFYPPAPNPSAAERADQVSAVVDPIHFVGRIAPRPLALFNATRDEMVSREATELLWEAARDPKSILWYDTGHLDLPLRAFRDMRDFLARHLGG